MAHLDIDTVLGWRGRTVRDAGGDRLGTFGDVFLDRETNEPAWGGVRTGLFGRHESFVPLDAVQPDAEDDLRVPFTAAEVKDAPRVDPDVSLNIDEEQALWRHYGRRYGHEGGDAPAVGAGGDLGDDAMTRSEEEVEVHQGAMRPAERVRLRKVTVTEHETRTVPVRKEVVQLETDPAPTGTVEEVVDAGEDPPVRR